MFDKNFTNVKIAINEVALQNFQTNHSRAYTRWIRVCSIVSGLL